MKHECILALILTCSLCGVGVAQNGGPEGGAMVNELERDAMKMFRRGMALMKDRQEERAVKVLDGVLRNFPRALARHKAALELGKYHIEQGEYQVALKKLESVLDAEDSVDDERAEAMYRIGICYYEEGDANRALTTLRRVTETYPWSVYANEAYYYIGLCHFSAKRWTKAVEALKMVGTSVPPSEKERTLAEAGQRYLVKVYDKDLRVLEVTGDTIEVRVAADSGDTEVLEMEVFDPEGEYYLADIKTEPGEANPGDGLLQFVGRDVVRALYVDNDTLDGRRNERRLAVSRLVSTASGGFMDGAFREYVKGVFSEQKAYMRVNDYDADVTDGRDKVQVKLISRRRLTEEEIAIEGLSPDEGPHYKLRDELTYELTESGPHTGTFDGTIVVAATEEDEEVNRNDRRLQAVEGDDVVMEYTDKEHIASVEEPRKVVSSAEFLIGEIPDVWVAHRQVKEAELRARKNLLEAAFFLRLGEIFRDVGLVDRAEDKADIGLEKANSVLRQSLTLNIGRELVEEAYQRKWELELVKGDLAAAIETCRTLMSLYPTSSLADVALMQIAKASIEGGDNEQAFRLLKGILSLNTSSDLKAEAQFNMALLLEKEAEERATERPEDKAKLMAPAIKAYQTCSERYPESPFAGEALGKVIDYHIEAREYERCIEMLEMAMVDYPDAAFMDEMLFKWGIVEARMQRYGEARRKFRQLLRDYPNSRLAGRAKQFLDRLSRVGS